MGYSISASQGRVAQYHDEREQDYTPANVDKNLSKDNKTLVKQDCSYHDAVNRFFKPSVDAYNAKQTRNDRKIDDYYQSLEDSNRKEKPVYEYVFQIGNHETNGVTSGTEDEAKCREALDAAMEQLQDKYPNLHFLFIGSHGDEPGGTYHYHVAFTPVGTGYKNGMSERCSLTKALNAMGFKTSNEDGLAIQQWQNDVKDIIEEEMKQRGLEREYMDNTDKHLSVSAFKRKKTMESMNDKNQELLENTQELEGLIAEYEQMSDDLQVEREQFEEEKQAVKDALQLDRERFDEEKGIYASEYQKAVETANTASEAYKNAEQTYKRAVEDVTMGYVPALQSYSKAVEAILTKITYNHGKTTALDKFGDALNKACFEASETAKASVKERLSYRPVQAKEQAVQELEPVKTEPEIEREVKVQTKRRLPRQPEAQVEDDSEYSY